MHDSSWFVSKKFKKSIEYINKFNFQIIDVLNQNYVSFTCKYLVNLGGWDDSVDEVYAHKHNELSSNPHNPHNDRFCILSL